MGEIIFHIILLAFIALFFKETSLITTGRATDPIGPAGFPQAILILAFILLAISLYKVIKNRKLHKQETLNLNFAFYGILISMFVFAIITDFIGFPISAVLFCFAMFFTLGERAYVKMSIQSIVISIALTLIFGKILSVALPRGIGIIKEFSYFLY